MTPTTTHKQAADRQALRDLVNLSTHRATAAVRVDNLQAAADELSKAQGYLAKLSSVGAFNGYSINAAQAEAIPVPAAGRYSLNDL